MAEIEKDNDYDSAIELLTEALDTAKEQMIAYSPELSATMRATGLQENVEGAITLSIKNNGRAMAKEVRVAVNGDFKAKEVPVIPALRPGTEATMEVKLTPSKNGSVPIVLIISSKRPMDSRSQALELEETLNVFPAGPPFRLGRATDATRCIS